MKESQPFYVSIHDGVVWLTLLPILDRSALNEDLFARALRGRQLSQAHSAVCNLAQTGVIDSAVLACIARWQLALGNHGVDHFFLTGTSNQQRRVLMQVPATAKLQHLSEPTGD